MTSTAPTSRADHVLRRLGDRLVGPGVEQLPRHVVGDHGASAAILEDWQGIRPRSRALQTKSGCAVDLGT